MLYKEPFTFKFDSGILIARYTVGYADLEVAKRGYDARIKMTNNKSYPLLVDLRSLVAMDRDAKEFLAKDEAYQYILAGALLVKSVFQKMGATLYLMIRKQPIPTRIFTNEAEAMEWLKTHRIEDK